jgi:RND family efflux transporter MFP subunit
MKKYTMAVLLLLPFISYCESSPVASAHAVKVETTKLASHHFQKVFRVQGTVEPVERANIAARVSGTIDIFKLSEGDHVKKGQVLFQIDQANLENQVALKKAELKVVQETKVATRIDVDIAKTKLEKARLDFKRAKKLFLSRAVSESAYENAMVALKNAVASYKKAIAILNYTTTKVKQVKVLLEIAKKNLADSIAVAPYDAVVTCKAKEEKEYAAAGTTILQIENQRDLEVSCIISAVYSRVISKKTPIDILFDGKVICKTVLNYRASFVDPLSRTFEIKANLPKNCPLMSGTLCNVNIILMERSGVGLPTNAILLRKGGKYIAFEALNGKAREVHIDIGIISSDYTEILNAKKMKGKNFIISGQYFVNDGTPVTIINTKSK